MSVAERAPGPDLPERVELIRAALPDADRARFEQELDQALSTARSTQDLRPLCHIVAHHVSAFPRCLRLTPLTPEIVELTTARGRSTTNQTARAGAATG